MKKFLLIVVSLAVLLAGGWYATLHLSLASIKSAVDRKDAEALSPYVDYDELRANLKEQLRGEIVNRMGDQSNPFAVLGAAALGGFTDKLVDAQITPEGLGQLMRGESDIPILVKDGSDPAPPSDGEPEPLEHGRFKIVSPTRVNIITGGAGEEIRFVFDLRGIRWRLTNVILPLPEDSD